VANKITAVHAAITEGPGVNFGASGDDVQTIKNTGKAVRNTCDGKFVPFPDGN